MSDTIKRMEVQTKVFLIAGIVIIAILILLITGSFNGGVASNTSSLTSVTPSSTLPAASTTPEAVPAPTTPGQVIPAPLPPAGTPATFPLVCDSTVNGGDCAPLLKNGACSAFLTDDGRLQVSNGTSLTYNSDKFNTGVGPFKLVMQTDGNLVSYDSKGLPIWAAGTDKKGTGPYKALLQDT